jgi:hypothetical protein
MTTDRRTVLLDVERDEDLAWVEEQIRRCEDNAGSPFSESEMEQARREHLDRLRRMRARLLGEAA